jgi:hypothetical protein
MHLGHFPNCCAGYFFDSCNFIAPEFRHGIETIRGLLSDFVANAAPLFEQCNY